MSLLLLLLTLKNFVGGPMLSDSRQRLKNKKKPLDFNHVFSSVSYLLTVDCTQAFLVNSFCYKNIDRMIDTA